MINISLDILIFVKFEFIIRRKGWERVMNSIDIVIDLGYSFVKVNCVVMRGVNEEEIVDFVKLIKDKNIDVRFIEYMFFDGNKWNFKKMVFYVEMIDIIKFIFLDFRRMLDYANDIFKVYKVFGYEG